MSSPARHKSIRLPGHDYSSPGRLLPDHLHSESEVLFGHVADSEMVQNVAGLMVGSWWGQLERKYPTILLMRSW